MRNTYTVVISIPQEAGGIQGISNVDSGLFSGSDSLSHITLNCFQADQKELSLWIKYMEHFCRHIIPFEVVLHKAKHYPTSETYYLAPDEHSKKLLTKLMNDFNKSAPLKILEAFYEPHVTIAAQHVSSSEDFNFCFNCNNLVLRELDLITREYIHVGKPFEFMREEQLTLF